VERTNCQIVLLADEGRNAPEIAWLVRRGPHQVRKVLHRFRSESLAGLAPHKAPGRALEVTPAWLAELQRVIDLDPHTVDVPSAVWTTRLLSAYLERVTGHNDGHRNRADPPASSGLRVQTTDVVHEAKIDRTSWVGKKRVRVEVLLAAAAAPVPPPIDDLLPDVALRDQIPDDLAWLLRLVPRADVYLQDEVEIALHPTLTRVWSPRGRRRQRLVEAPGNNEKQYGFGLVDWREGWLDWERAPGRRAAPFCAQLRRAVARSQARGRMAMVFLDNLGIHTPKGSLLLRQLVTELRGQLVLVYTPAYDPESNRIEWLWRSFRREVTHDDARQTLPPLLEDADTWAATISPMDILRQIGSPFADGLDPSQPDRLEHAA